jgi:quinol monooxygenase YgiN
MAAAKYIPYAIGAAVGAVIAVALGHVLPCPVPLKRNAKRVFVLAVRLKLVPGTVEAFKARWAVLAANCRSSAEPNCLSYELLVSESDPNEILIYERYIARSDLDVTHAEQPAFQAFGKWAAEESGAELLKDGRKSIVRGSLVVTEGRSSSYWTSFASSFLTSPRPSLHTLTRRCLKRLRSSTWSPIWAT